MLTYRMVQSEFWVLPVNSQLAGSRTERCGACVATLLAGGSKVAPKNEEAKAVIRKLQSGKYRLYSRKADPRTGKRKNLGTFNSRAAAEKHEREVQYFKRH
jgi:hypothetical protein